MKKSPRSLKGSVQKNSRGFAFILPEDRTLEDAYVPQYEAQTLMDGDRVEYRLHREGRRTFAEIVRILERGTANVLGRLRRMGSHWKLEPTTGDLFSIESAGIALKEGFWAIGRITEFPTKTRAGKICVEQLLGERLSPKTDNTVAIARYNLPHLFSDPTLREVEKAQDLYLAELAHPSELRRDLSQKPFVTIDGRDAKDFDDAILVESSSGETAFILYVAIADVSFFVRPGTLVDKSARERGTSIYFPGTCIPMLPELLSNDLCSLRPKKKRLTLTAEIHYDRNAEVRDVRFYPSVIQTARRLTYHEVQEFFDHKTPADFDSVAEPLQVARHLYQKLLKKRKHRGVLDFELPESVIALDKDGTPMDIQKAEHWDSHRLIEEFMIAANSAVARILRESKASSLYRVHGTPEADKIEEINLMLKSLGVSSRIVEISPRHLSKVLEETAKSPGAKTLHQLILRAQKQADYQPEPKGHFGLALKDYTHFTSPIRRYPDLVVHRALKQLIVKRQDADKYRDKEDFHALGELCSRRERRAMEAERYIVRRKQCWFMKEHLGDEYEGIVSGAIETGCFVELGGLGIEGFIPAQRMDQRPFKRRPGKSLFGLGQSVRVLVESVDVEEGRIELSPV